MRKLLSQPDRNLQLLAIYLNIKCTHRIYAFLISFRAKQSCVHAEKISDIENEVRDIPAALKLEKIC
jgi:hypothetical protein